MNKKCFDEDRTVQAISLKVYNAVVFRTWCIILNFLRSSHCQGVKCRQLDFSCFACQMCAFFWQLFFFSICLSDSHAQQSDDICMVSPFVIFMTRKYPLRGYFLGVLTHTTAWDRLWGGDETLKQGFKIKYKQLYFTLLNIVMYLAQLHLASWTQGV